MNIKTAADLPPAVRIFLDREAADALDRARRRERQSRAGFIRSLLLRRLHEAGDLPANTSTVTGR